MREEPRMLHPRKGIWSISGAEIDPMISRRALLAGSLAAPFVANAAARAQGLALLDVAIIGAGAAGLHAAHRARSRGLTARIFEASPRVGGRVFTDSSLGSDFEAGA
ncbi:MAG: NAD(P)-binding protein, partial [Methylobacterium sp.]|nr:NAD(P)-binding protein [Methylobacterium sp.]